jgi:hypothetical protein
MGYDEAFQSANAHCLAASFHPAARAFPFFRRAAFWIAALRSQ